MLDTILRGASLVEAEGIAPRDIGILDGRIAALLAPGAPATAVEAIDCSGRLVLPGLVDCHVHLREPGLTAKEDFASGTRAAIAGGVTTVLDMPTDEPWTASVAEFAEKKALASGRIYADVGLQVAVGSDFAAIEPLAAMGAVSFEIFTTDAPAPFRHADAARIEAALAAVAAAGALATLMPGVQPLNDARAASGPGGVNGFMASRPPSGEAMGIARAVAFAAEIGGRVHVRHANSALGMRFIAALRDIADVSFETSCQYLFFTGAIYDRLAGRAKAAPPFRGQADVDAVRRAVADGAIDMVGTDHAPHEAAEKDRPAEEFDTIPGGFPGLQTLLPAMLRLVADGVIDLPRLVALTSTRPAARFGLGHRKGRLQPGYDADIVVIDPQRDDTVRDADQYSKAGYTLFDGMEVPFTIERVMLRGRTACLGGKVEGDPVGIVL